MDAIFQIRREVGGVVYLILEGTGRSSIGIHTMGIFAGLGSSFSVFSEALDNLTGLVWQGVGRQLVCLNK